MRFIWRHIYTGSLYVPDMTVVVVVAAVGVVVIVVAFSVVVSVVLPRYKHLSSIYQSLTE